MGIIYKIVVGLFRLAITVFYSGVFIVDSQNVPGDGVPTIIVANHANSLVDAMLLLSCAPRMVRLTAKATLWKVRPFTMDDVRGRLSVGWCLFVPDCFVLLPVPWPGCSWY